jgi:hypothetical protein
MPRVIAIAALLLLLCASSRGADKEKAKPAQGSDGILFNTPEADKICAKLKLTPKDHPFTLNIAKWPVHPDSDKIIAFIGDGVLAANQDMNFVIAGKAQKKVPCKLTTGADESDPGPYPIPDNAPIKEWPAAGEKDLAKFQAAGDGDRHLIVLQPDTGTIFEFYNVWRRGTGWEAYCEATWDKDKGWKRPAGWTSADAAGLPIFPLTPRYDEFEKGEINHPLRVTFKITRKEYLFPATHYASKNEDPAAPAMGMRFRLKKSFDSEKLGPQAKIVAKALATYGMFCADNGSNWRVSMSPDPRIPAAIHQQLKAIKSSDFEVVHVDAKTGKPPER